MATEIPGLFDSKSQANHSIGMTSPMTANSAHHGGDGGVLDELLAEKGSLGPNFVHSNQLLDQEIARVRSGDKETGGSMIAYHLMDPNKVQTGRVFIPFELQKQHNLIGRLLGPKGITLKRIQLECHAKMSILGRGSMKDRHKEEELRSSGEPVYAHLKDNLHVQIEAAPPFSNMKLAAGVADIKKMLIPPAPGQPDPLLARYLDPQMGGGFPPPQGGPSGPGQHGPGRGGPLIQSPGGRGRGGMRGGPPRGRGGRGGGSFDSPRGGRGGGRGGGSGPVGGRPYTENPYADRQAPSSGGWREPRAEARYFDPPNQFPSRVPPDDYSRDKRDVGYEERSYREERRGGGDYGRSSDPYSSLTSDSEPYYSSFSDAPSRGSQYGRDSLSSSDYHHGTSSGDWKSPRSSRREGSRHHPYGQNSGSSSYF